MRRRSSCEAILFAQHFQVLGGDGLARFVFGVLGFLLPGQFVAEFVAFEAAAVEVGEALEQVKKLLWLLLNERGKKGAIQSVEGFIELKLGKMEASILVAGIAMLSLLAGQLELEFAVVETLLSFEPILITAVVPAAEVVFGEVADAIGPALAVFFQLANDAGVLSAIIEHVIDEITQVFGQTSDFAGAFMHK